LAILILLFASLVLYRVLGSLGVSLLATWINSARFAIATMFLFTAASHFAPTKKDLIKMVPPMFPRPDLIVLITGAMEVAGAIGLLFGTTRWWAAQGLVLLLIIMFPATITDPRK
jgi:uncharacterized membrane protein